MLAGMPLSPISRAANKYLGKLPNDFTRLQDSVRGRLQAADETKAQSRAGLAGFDPMRFMTTAAEGAYAGLSDELAARDEETRVRNNARGFFNSPVGHAANRHDFQRQLAQALAGLAMQAGQMDMSRLNTIYQGDRDDAAMYFDADVGLTMTKEQQRLADKANKRSFWGNLITGGLGAAAIAFSDETLKKDIEEVEPVLPRVKKLRGVGWRWNRDGKRVTGDRSGKRRHGVIAQDVEEVFPELVRDAADVGKKQVNYGGLTATLVRAIGELDDKIEAVAGGRK